MKNFKKIISLLLIFTMVLSLSAVLAGCGDTTASDSEDGYEIALITDKGNIDDKSFNQGAWEGVKAYCEANDISHKYYKPEEASDAGYLASIELAIQGGAKTIVTPGYLFEVPVYEAQTKYPDVKFILLDGAPHTADYVTFETKSNTASIFYEEEQSGYLAGYAIVKDGNTDLGFMGGMAVPAVQAFGYGYLQGAEAAANEMDVDVKVTYHYTGNFDENDTNKSTAKTIYQSGAQVIFACGGSVGKSVMSAAEEVGAKVIGVDTDQRYDSETVVTSATKNLKASVIAVLKSIYETESFDTFGGVSTYFSAENDGIGLPTSVIGDDSADAFDRFESFNIDDYNAVFAQLENNEIALVRTFDVEDASGYATAEELTSHLMLNRVTVETLQ